MNSISYLIFGTLCVNVNGETCLTPSGQVGECISIRLCSSLLWSFTNPKYGIDEYLEKFVCANRDLGLMVCCPIPSDYLVFENDEDFTDPPDINDVQDLTNSKECGVPTNLINNNGFIRLQDFPWLVKILTADNTLKSPDRVEKVGCTGVLINKLYVLYSAQCHNTILVKDPNFFVRIDTYTNKREDCDATSYSPKCSIYENYEIEAFTIHPFYDALTKINDIAILRLSRQVYYTEFIRPICLPISGESASLGQTLQTAGWNRTFRLNDFSVKTSQPTTFISNQDCKSRLFKSGNNSSLSSYEICTYSGESTVDKNIVGFPLMSLHNNKWYLQGFESQNNGVKIHTRVQNYMQWVKEAMGGERCLTPFNQTGECMDLSDCPKLMDAFANPAPEDEEALREFVCEYPGEDANDETYTLKVCCKLTSDFITPTETVKDNLDFEVSNFKYCGLQHRDDYYSPSETISVDEFPWLAVILNDTAPNERDIVCGGSLITYQYVLTSAQCSHKFYSDDIMLVRLGDYNLKNSTDCVQLTQFDLYDCSDIQEYEVEQETIHPFYNSYTFINDISLLRLNKKVGFTDYVRPICLPRSEDDLGNYGATLFTTGFGNKNINVEGPKIKKKIQTTLISTSVCKEKLKMLRFSTPITPYHICSEDFKNSTDVMCEGDEGGPVMLSKKSRWFIEGISSSYGCGDDEPQTHLRVFKYIKWIKLNIKD